MQVDNLTYSAKNIKEEIPELSEQAEQIVEVLKESRYIFEQLFTLNIDFNLSKDEENNLTTKISLIPPLINYARVVQLIFQLNYYKLVFSKILHAELNETLQKRVKACIKRIDIYLSVIEEEYIK